MSATTTATPVAASAVSVKPTTTWVPLPIEGNIPAPFEDSEFGLKVTPLHPTFGCELEGVDWSKPVSPKLYKKIRGIADKVRLSPMPCTLADKL